MPRLTCVNCPHLRQTCLTQVNRSGEAGLRNNHSLNRKRNKVLASEPLLTATPAGGLLELRPAGSWTAANVVTLETLTAAVEPELDRSANVRLDMTGVSELDTLGAWLLEKLSRRAATSGHHADVVGVADNYAGLIAELRQVNRRAAKPVTSGVEHLFIASRAFSWR